jgi:hypothetical protein
LSLQDHVLPHLSASQRVALRHVETAARGVEAVDRARIADLLARAGCDPTIMREPSNVFAGVHASCCIFTLSEAIIH